MLSENIDGAMFHLPLRKVQKYIHFQLEHGTETARLVYNAAASASERERTAGTGAKFSRRRERAAVNFGEPRFV